MACCTRARSEWERGCARSSHVPEEPEPLRAYGEPCSKPESPTCLMGLQRSKRPLLKVLFPYPKQLCQRLD